MSTLIEHSFYEQVLYRGKSKQKWEQRNVSVKRSVCNGKYLVKVLPTQRRPILWRRKKPETVELTPNSHAIIHMATLGNQRNVVGLLQVRRGSQISGHFFTSEHRDVLSNLQAVLAKCCDVTSFEVDFDAALKSSTSTKAQLHIFHDKICLSTNLGYEFKLLGEWPIDSLTRLLTAHGGVTLIMTNEARQENTLLLRTERGNDICSKLAERHRCIAPARHQQLLFQYSNSAAGVTQCDGNSNIMSASRLSKSCDEFIHQLHFEPLSSKANSLPLANKVKPPLDSRHLSSLSRLPSYLEAKSPLSSEGSIGQEEDVHNFTDSCSSTSTEPSSSSENDINAVPPPIPRRQLKPNPANAEITEQAKGVLICGDKYSERNTNVEDFPIQRSHSFQIVEQPLPGAYRKRQRYKSDSSLVMCSTVITELVRPICFDLPSANSRNPCGSYMYLQENMAVDTGTEPCNRACSPKQDEENACSPPISKSGFEASGHGPSTTLNRASTHPLCILTSNNDVQLVDEENQVKEEVHSSDSTCHYVNLPRVQDQAAIFT